MEKTQELDIENGEINPGEKISFLKKCRKFFSTHFLVTKLFLVILVLIILCFGFIFLSPDKDGSTVLTATDGIQKSQTSVNGSTQVVQQDRKLTKLELIPHIVKFNNYMISGSFDKALQNYEDIIKLSGNSDYYTANDQIDVNQKEALLSVIKKIQDTNDNRTNSILFQEKGIHEYEIGSYLYYLDPEKYYLPVLYYYILSVESFDKSIDLYDNALSHREKGRVLLDFGLHDTLAMLELQKAIKLNPNDEVAYYKLGNSNHAIKEYATAIDYYLSGIAINPKHELMQINLGLSYFMRGDRTKGYELYEKLISNCREYCNMAYYNLALQMLDEPEKDYNKILSIFDKAIQTASMKNEIYRNSYRLQGKIFYEMKEMDKALAVLKISLNDPNDKKMSVNVFNQNDIEEDTYEFLAKIYIESGDFKLADQYLRQGIRKYPKDKDLRKLFEDLKSKQTI